MRVSPAGPFGEQGHRLDLGRIGRVTETGHGQRAQPVPGLARNPQTLAAGGQDPQSIQRAIIRSPYQCLIAEIAFDPVAIPAGVDPSTTDKLAQRNLAFVSIPNPGQDGSRRAPQPFEMRPTPEIKATSALTS